MKTLLLGIAASLGTFAGAALGADMPVKAPPLQAVTSTPGWSGCYIGGNLGWIGGEDRLTLSPGTGFPSTVTPNDRTVDTHTHEPHGSAFTGGVQAGCNLQLGQSWVVGAEGDFNWSGLRESSFTTYDFIPFASTPIARWDAHNETVWKDLDWFSTIRARLGYVWNNVLFYPTAGLAIARINGRFSYLDTVLGFEFAGSEVHTRLGPAIGAGVEWAFARQWSLKAEYLYMDFGSFSFDAPPNVPGATLRWDMEVKAREQIGRIGLNYRF
jgi:outer membrane immunogenic protein